MHTINAITAIKLKRNDKCHCNSGKKYKKCCLDNDMIRKSENKIVIDYINGHEVTPDVQEMYNYFSEIFPTFKVIDVSNIAVGKGSYRTVQEANYFSETIMLSARNEKNNKLFQDRGDRGTDLMVMFRGAHQVFSRVMFNSMKDQLNKMIKVRLNNQNYAY